MENTKIQIYKNSKVQRVEARRVDEVPRGLLLARDKVYNEVQKDQIKYSMNVRI